MKNTHSEYKKARFRKTKIYLLATKNNTFLMNNSLCFTEFQQALDFVELDEQTRSQIAETVFQTFCNELSKQNKSKPGYSTIVVREPALARQFKITERRAARLSRRIDDIKEDLNIFRKEMGNLPKILTTKDFESLLILSQDINHRSKELDNCREKLRLDQEFMNSISHDTLMSDETSSSSSEF